MELKTATSLKAGYELSATANFWHRAGAVPGADPEAGHILQSLRKCSDVSLYSAEVQQRITDWSTRFHLSSGRANILRPFTRLLNRQTLEIGCGCGPVTRFLGELGGDVVAVEPSMGRAEAAAVRTRDLDNVSIVCDSAEQFEWKGQFNAIVVTALGEHEDGAKGVESLLARLREWCAADGCLILAGKNEAGLEQIAGGAKGIGRRELTGLLERAGFAGFDWYLPLPSAKMTSTLIYPAGYSGQYPSFNLQTFFVNAVFADAERGSSPLFSVEGAWLAVERNGLAPELVNSYMVLAHGPEFQWPDAENESTLAMHYGSGRRAEFLKEVRIQSQDDTLVVRKKRLLDREPPSESPYRMDIHDEEYISGAVLSDGLVAVVNRPGWSVWDVAQWAEPWVKLLATSVVELGDMNLGQKLPRNYVDAVPFNVVVTESGELRWIDLEWEGATEPELGFVLVRGLFWALGKITSVATPSQTVPENIADIVVLLVRNFGFKCTGEDVRRFLEMEVAFGAFVTDSASAGEASGLLGLRLNIRPDPGALAALSQTLFGLRSRIHENLSDIAQVRRDFGELESGFEAKHDALQPRLSALHERILQESSVLHTRAGELEKRFEERDKQLQPRLSELDERLSRHRQALNAQAAEAERRFEEREQGSLEGVKTLASMQRQLGQIQETITGQKSDLQALAVEQRESSARLAAVVENLTATVQASLNKLDSRQAAVERTLPQLTARMTEAERRAEEIDEMLRDCLDDLKSLEKSQFAQSLRLETLAAKAHAKIPSLTTNASVS